MILKPLLLFSIGFLLNETAFCSHEEELDGASQRPSFSIKDFLENIDPGDLARIKKVLQSIPPMQATHTKFGVGLRTKYPQNPMTDLLKSGKMPDDYKPIHHTADIVKQSVWASGKPAKDAWADPENPEEIAAQITSGRKRVTGSYIQQQNPMGLTGITGQGELGLHGKNPAADPVPLCVLCKDLCVLVTKRADNGELSLAGGMLDPTDPNISAAAARELKEETHMSISELKEKGQLIELGVVYEDYVDDPRNTDTSWMKTTAVAYALDPSAFTEELRARLAQPGDETSGSKWVSVYSILSGEQPVFASHKQIIADAVRKVLSLEESLGKRKDPE